MSTSLQLCCITLVVFCCKSAFADTLFHGQFLETLSLSSDYTLSHSAYDLGSLPVGPMDFLYTLNLLPERYTVPAPLVSQLNEDLLICISMPQQADNNDQNPVSNTVVCITHPDYPLASEVAIDTTSISDTSTVSELECQTNTIDDSASVKVAFKMCHLPQTPSTTKYAALPKEPYNNQPPADSKHPQLHDALLASGALEYTKKGTGKQSPLASLPSTIYNTLFHKNLLLPEPIITVYMFRSGSQSLQQARREGTQIGQSDLIEDIRGGLAQRQSATLPPTSPPPVLTLREQTQTSNYLSEENVQRVLQSQASWNTYSDEALMGMAVDIRRIMVAIQDNKDNARPIGVSLQTELELMVLEESIKEKGRERHSQRIESLFSEVQQHFFQDHSSAPEILSSLRTNITDLSAIMEYFGSDADKIRHQFYLSETTARLQSIHAQTARERAFDLLRNFNDSPEHCTRITLATLMLFETVVAELADLLKPDQSQEKLTQAREELARLAHILELISKHPRKFPNLQQDAKHNNVRTIQHLTNQVTFNLRYAESITGTPYNQERHRELDNLGLTGQIDPSAINAMSQEDFIAIIAVLRGGSIDPAVIEGASFDLTHENQPLVQRAHATNIIRTFGDWEQIENSRTGAQVFQGRSEDVRRVIEQAGDINKVDRERVFLEQSQRWKELTKKSN